MIITQFIIYVNMSSSKYSSSYRFPFNIKFGDIAYDSMKYVGIRIIPISIIMVINCTTKEKIYGFAFAYTLTSSQNYKRRSETSLKPQKYQFWTKWNEGKVMYLASHVELTNYKKIVIYAHKTLTNTDFEISSNLI